MAGTAKPNIDNLKTEGKITFLQTYRVINDIKDLINNNIYDDNFYGCFMYGDCSWFTFNIPQKSNIHSYGIPYEGRGGKGIGKNVKLYKKINNEFVLIKNNVSTKIGEWYLLFENLTKGEYKLMTLGDVIFTEWYIENIQEKYIFKINDSYYTVDTIIYDNTDTQNRLIPLQDNEFNDKTKWCDDLLHVNTEYLKNKNYTIIKGGNI